MWLDSSREKQVDSDLEFAFLHCYYWKEIQKVQLLIKKLAGDKSTVKICKFRQQSVHTVYF